MTAVREARTIHAGHGLAVALKAGQSIAIVNTSGTQVVDTWAFCDGDLSQFMSMEHSRVQNGRLSPTVSEAFVTNRREPILRLIADTSPGIHDTIMAACDARRYELLGCEGHHRNCADNLREAMAGLGHEIDSVPSPLNLFMNIPIGTDGSLTQGEPPAKAGDRVVLLALRDCIVAMSACPQDMTPINGGAPSDAGCIIDPGPLDP